MSFAHAALDLLVSVLLIMEEILMDVIFDVDALDEMVQFRGESR